MRPAFTTLRWKLAASLAVIAGVAVAATLVTGITLDRVSRSVANLAVENLGASAVNARFAEIGQAIRVEVPALGDAQTQFERETALERLTDHFGGIRELLGQAKRSEGGYSVGLGDVISSLEANIRDLDTNVGKRFFLKSALAQQVTRINRLHAQLAVRFQLSIKSLRDHIDQLLMNFGARLPASVGANGIAYLFRRSDLGRAGFALAKHGRLRSRRSKDRRKASKPKRSVSLLSKRDRQSLFQEPKSLQVPQAPPPTFLFLYLQLSKNRRETFPSTFQQDQNP